MYPQLETKIETHTKYYIPTDPQKQQRAHHISIATWKLKNTLNSMEIDTFFLPLIGANI